MYDEEFRDTLKKISELNIDELDLKDKLKYMIAFTHLAEELKPLVDKYVDVKPTKFIYKRLDEME